MVAQPVTDTPATSIAAIIAFFMIPCSSSFNLQGKSAGNFQSFRRPPDCQGVAASLAGAAGVADYDDQ